MNNLPVELNYEIGNYLFDCQKNYNYIINKEFYEIFKKKTKKCDKVKLLGKNLCTKCEKKKIWRARMILNNLLPG